MRVPDLLLAAALLFGAAGPAAARQAAPAAKGSAPAAPAAEPELRFERETFLYPTGARRDPFSSLADRNEGPRFEDLVLRGIVYSPTGVSVALIADHTGRSYRLRRGEVVGNARVLDIAAARVLFAVENFGVVRQEQLEMKRKQEGDR